MRILFLNQYFPPDPAPTGILLKEVADALVNAGHEVVFASSGQDYREGQRKGSRMKRELGGLWRIWKSALAAGKVDAVVSATSPPLLVVVGAVIAKLRRARHCHWLFDMYPELATALGEIPDGLPAKIFRMATQWAYRRADCVVALDEDMAARLRPWGVKTRIIPPWVFGTLLETRTKALAGAVERPPDVERVWLYSGNLGRAHEWRTLIDAQKRIEEAGSPWRLIFQGGGPAWPGAQAYAQELGLKRCDWRPYVPEEELPASLLKADVLAITQRPETCGLLWPSKLALAMSLPRPILWVGLADKAIAGTLTKAGWSGVFTPGNAEGVAKWLQQGAGGEVTQSLRHEPAAIREDGLREWVEIVTGTASPG